MDPNLVQVDTLVDEYEQKLYKLRDLETQLDTLKQKQHQKVEIRQSFVHDKSQAVLQRVKPNQCLTCLG